MKIQENAEYKKKVPIIQEAVQNLLVARVSDVEQRKALPAQEKRLLEYARRKKWDKNNNYKYIEFDETAYKKNRKTFNELVLDPIRDFRGKTILVFDKIDRFSRDSSSEEKAEMIRLCQEGKLEMHFPSDNLFFHKDSPASDKFRLDIGISLAAFYSASIRDNVKRRFEELLSKGVWVHRAPVGYKNVAVDVGEKTIKDIVIDKDRAHYVIQAFELRAQGMPYSLIAKELLKNGYTSRKTGKPQITKSDVEKIINNKFYYGIMTQSGVEYKHKYEPVIDRALFNQCLLVKEKRKGSATKWGSKDYTLSGIVSCGKCGRAVSSFKSKEWVYLTCANPECDNPNTAESLVMGSIEAIIKNLTIPDELMPKVIEELKLKHDDQQEFYSQSLDTVRNEYDEIDRKLDRFFEQMVEERITPEQHDKIVGRLQARQEDLNDKLKSLTKGNQGFTITASYLLDLANRAEELFNCSDEALRSKLLGFLLSNIKLNDKKLTFKVNYPFVAMIDENKKPPEGGNSLVWCG